MYLSLNISHIPVSPRLSTYCTILSHVCLPDTHACSLYTQSTCHINLSHTLAHIHIQSHTPRHTIHVSTHTSPTLSFTPFILPFLSFHLCLTFSVFSPLRFYSITQWPCSANGLLWDTVHTYGGLKPGPLPHQSGGHHWATTSPLSHHIL